MPSHAPAIIGDEGQMQLQKPAALTVQICPGAQAPQQVGGP